MQSHPLINIAVRAVRRAGSLIVRNIDRIDKVAVDEKGRNDLVTEIDRQAEREIIATILKAHPNHSILAEESGAKPGRSEVEWIIDPLDGTSNFVRGLPHFAVSIGIRIRKRLEHGVIFDPLRQEMFTVSRGAGARLDDRRIRVSPRESLVGAILGTGFANRGHQRIERHLEACAALLAAGAEFRQGGSAALELAWVAAGRLDGYWESGLSPWDIAAGALLVLEAGGLVSEPDGGSDYLRSGRIMAANPRLLREMAGPVHRSLPAENDRREKRDSLEPSEPSRSMQRYR